MSGRRAALVQPSASMVVLTGRTAAKDVELLLPSSLTVLRHRRKAGTGGLLLPASMVMLESPGR